MTSKIFKQWLYKWDRKCRLKNRKIILTMDNCSAHPQAVQAELTHIKLEFLPKNTTAMIQPLDAGIIRNFKYFYKSYLRQQIIIAAETYPKDDVKALSKRVDVLEALKLSAQAWKSVTKETIANCFTHAFNFNNNGESEPLDVTKDVVLPEGLNFETLDEEIQIENELEEVILEQVEEDENESEEEEEEINIVPSCSVEEAMKAYLTLKNYFDSTGAGESITNGLHEQETFLARKKTEKSTTQSRISNFFGTNQLILR